MNGTLKKTGPESGAGLRREMFDADDFWKRVHHDAEDRCWYWAGGHKEAGYGTYYANGRSNAAHRVAYALHAGALAPGMTVRHKCDNPPCVNPNHLVAGTQTQNVQDRDERSRRQAPRGVRNGHSKVNDDRVREIVTAVALGESQVAVARRLGIEKSTVGKIVRGQSWVHVERPKPWHDAKVGDVWVIRLRGEDHETACLVESFEDTHVFQMPDAESITTTRDIVETARRIWPEGVS